MKLFKPVDQSIPVQIKLSGCLRYIKIIAEKGIDRSLGLLVELVRDIVSVNFFQELLTHLDRKFINQPADTEPAEIDDCIIGIEYSSDRQRSQCILICTRESFKSFCRFCKCHSRSHHRLNV